MIPVKSNRLYLNPAVMFLKSTHGKSSDTSVLDREKDSTSEKEQAQEKRVILCSFCANTITDVNQIISVNGSHQHLFVNPYGLAFDTGCFKQCDGCIVDSRSSVEFSWFHGYSWSIAGCSQCRQHLGWFFLSDRLCSSDSAGSKGSLPSSILHHSFYCLILENLIIP